MTSRSKGPDDGFWIACAILIIAFYHFDDMRAEGGSLIRALIHFIWTR